MMTNQLHIQVELQQVEQLLSSGAYTQIIADEDTPDILYYQCSSHAHTMGFGVFFTTRNLTGFTTDDLTEGSTKNMQLMALCKIL